MSHYFSQDSDFLLPACVLVPGIQNVQVATKAVDLVANPCYVPDRSIPSHTPSQTSVCNPVEAKVVGELSKHSPSGLVAVMMREPIVMPIPWPQP